LTGYFSQKTLDELHLGRLQIREQFVVLNGRYHSRSYKSERAREYAVHGFCRRLGTLMRAVDRVYEVLPPEREDIPEREDVDFGRFEGVLARLVEGYWQNRLGHKANSAGAASRTLDPLAWLLARRPTLGSEDR
jgi:hypothetical protein